jgi:hypothetical protein
MFTERLIAARGGVIADSSGQGKITDNDKRR